MMIMMMMMMLDSHHYDDNYNLCRHDQRMRMINHVGCDNWDHIWWWRPLALCRQSTRLPGLFSGLGTHLTWVSLTWGLSMDILLEPAPKLPHKMQKKCKQLSVKHLPSLVITCYFIQSSENASLWIHEYRMRIENTCKFDFRSVCGQFACKIHYDQLDWGCQLNTEWLWNNS